MEKARLNKKLLPDVAKFFLNRAVIYTFLNFAMCVVIYQVFGFKTLVFQLCYAFVSMVFISVTNYIEHYGLVRK